MPATGPADRKALDAILEKAAVDREFRQLLMVDWRRAVHESFGIVVPSNFTMRFIERDPSVDALIVLPDFKNTASEGELSDHELESVAGGTDPDPSSDQWW